MNVPQMTLALDSGKKYADIIPNLAGRRICNANTTTMAGAPAEVVSPPD